MNIYAKLLQARVDFLAKGTKKSGKNRAIMYNYFELDDIVPIATEIFAKLGLISIVNFSDTMATMTVVNCETPDECVLFSAPLRVPEPNKGTNEVQCMGSAITYYRRYLYMMALNIIESDGIDCGKTEPKAEEKTTKVDKPIEIKAEAKKPATPTERKEIKKEIVDADGLIDDAMRDVLIRKVAELVKAKPETRDMVIALKDKTNGFVDIKKSDYNNFLTTITSRIGG